MRECDLQRFAINGFFHCIVGKDFLCGVIHLHSKGVFLPLLICFWNLHIIQRVHAFGVFPVFSCDADGLDRFSRFGSQFDFGRNLFFIVHNLHFKGLGLAIILDLNGFCSLLRVFLSKGISLIRFRRKAFCLAVIPAFFPLFAAFFRHQIDVQRAQIQLVSHAIHILEQFCIQCERCHSGIICLVVDHNIIGIVFPASETFPGRNFAKVNLPVVIFLMIKSFCQQAVLIVGFDIFDLAFRFDGIIEFLVIQFQFLCFAVHKCDHQMGGGFLHSLLRCHHFGRHHNKAVLLFELYLQSAVRIHARRILCDDSTICDVGCDAILRKFLKRYRFCLAIRKAHFQHGSCQIQFFAKCHIRLWFLLKIKPLHMLFHLIGTIFFRTENSVFQCAQMSLRCFCGAGYSVISGTLFLPQLFFQLIHFRRSADILHMVQYILTSFETFILNMFFAVCPCNFAVLDNDPDNIRSFFIIIQAGRTCAVPYAIRQDAAGFFFLLGARRVSKKQVCRIFRRSAFFTREFFRIISAEDHIHGSHILFAFLCVAVGIILQLPFHSGSDLQIFFPFHNSLEQIDIVCRHCACIPGECTAVHTQFHNAVRCQRTAISRTVSAECGISYGHFHRGFGFAVADIDRAAASRGFVCSCLKNIVLKCAANDVDNGRFATVINIQCAAAICLTGILGFHTFYCHIAESDLRSVFYSEYPILFPRERCAVQHHIFDFHTCGSTVFAIHQERERSICRKGMPAAVQHQTFCLDGYSMGIGCGDVLLQTDGVVFLCLFQRLCETLPIGHSMHFSSFRRTAGTARGMLLLFGTDFLFFGFLFCSHRCLGLYFFSVRLNVRHIFPCCDFCIFRRNLYMVFVGIYFRNDACTANLSSLGFRFHFGNCTIFFHLNFSVFRAFLYLDGIYFPFFQRQDRCFGNRNIFKITG